MFLETDTQVTSAFTLRSLFVLHTGNTHSAIIQSGHVFVRAQGQLRPLIVVYPSAHVVQVLEEEWGHYKPTQEQEKTLRTGERGEQHNKFFQQMRYTPKQ